MFSDSIKCALEADVVGQSRAVNGLVRGVTRLASGMMPRERALCAYLFMGPTGTGKSHLVQTVARTLHGESGRVVLADCSASHAAPFMTLGAQLATLFAAESQGDAPAPVRQAPPLSIVQIDFLERGPAELAKGLAAALESGHVMLPDGSRGSLDNTLIVITSGLCASEILDEPSRIGFAAGSDDDEEDDEATDKLHTMCYERAVEHFGTDLVGQLDAFVVFHPLNEEHLEAILDRRIARLNAWLSRHGFSCELSETARRFLLGKGRRDLRLGARFLVRAHRKFIEFPVADLLVSRRVPPGGTVVIDRLTEDNHLHFTVVEPVDSSWQPGQGAREITVG